MRTLSTRAFQMTTRSRAVSIPFVAVALFLTGCGEGGQPGLPLRTLTGGPRCDVSPWSEPRPLVTRDGRPAYVETPQILSTPSGTVLLGTPTMVWATPDRFDPAPRSIAPTAAVSEDGRRFFGLRLHPDGTVDPVPAPAAAHRFVAPRGVVSPDGTIRSVWASVGADMPATRETPSELHSADIRAGGPDSVRRVFTADVIRWFSGLQPLVVGHRNDLHFVASFDVTNRGRGIAYIRSEGDRWVSQPHLLPGFPATPELLVTETDSVLVAYTATDLASGTRNGTHLWLVRAAITDSVWPRASLVRHSGLNGVGDPRLLRLGPGQLALLWTAFPPTLRRDSLFVTTSLDDGRTWSPPVSMRAAGGIGSISALADRYGTIHVIYRSLPPNAVLGDGPIHHAVWTGGQWAYDEELPFGNAESIPQVAQTRGDTLLLIWGVARRSRGGRAAPVALFSQLVTGPCAPVSR